ncbi:hypothetical protein [Acinetobacter puyangensis]|uniref:hypothetical protein n=1 Tax=Acinetobacter puyangensis TaxID=1096779 RepID=UPI003A4D440B
MAIAQDATIEACLKTLKQEAEYCLKNCPIEMIEKTKNGVIAIYNHDEIYEYDVSEVFTEDEIFKYVMYEELFKDFIKGIKDDPYIDENESFTEDELMQWYQDARNQIIFYRLKNKRIKSLKGALKVIRPVGFWLPTTIIINNEWHSTWELGAEDKDGNTLGIRF